MPSQGQGTCCGRRDWASCPSSGRFSLAKRAHEPVPSGVRQGRGLAHSQSSPWGPRTPRTPLGPVGSLHPSWLVWGHS